MKALILVDMQYDFLPGGSLAVPGGDALISEINALSGKYDLVVATQDWHPPDHKSFASQHVENQPFDLIELNGQAQTLWPDHCVQMTRGAELAKELRQETVEAIFRKGMDKGIDSYSGFFDNGHLRSTGLGDFLKGKNIRTVHVCGLAADFCVYFTAMDALDLGFEAAILERATLPIDAAQYLLKKQMFLAKGGLIME